MASRDRSRSPSPSSNSDYDDYDDMDTRVKNTTSMLRFIDKRPGEEKYFETSEDVTYIYIPLHKSKEVGLNPILDYLDQRFDRCDSRFLPRELRRGKYRIEFEYDFFNLCKIEIVMHLKNGLLHTDSDDEWSFTKTVYGFRNSSSSGNQVALPADTYEQWYHGQPHCETGIAVERSCPYASCCDRMQCRHIGSFDKAYYVFGKRCETEYDWQRALCRSLFHNQY
jgi:hypothetical protein